MSTDKFQNQIDAAKAWPFPVSNHVQANQKILPKGGIGELEKASRALDEATESLSKLTSAAKRIGRTGIVQPDWPFPTGPKPKHGFEGDLANLISLYQMDKDTGKTPAELASELVYEIEQRVIQQQH